MRILSIDTGNKHRGKKSIPSTGVAFFRDGQYDRSRLVEFSVPFMYRIIAEWYPGVVVYEWTNMQNQQRKKGATTQAYQQDAIRAICELREIPFVEMVPQTWRRLMGFPKNADCGANEKKRISMVKASEIAGHEIADDNEADAICVGMAYIISNEEKLAHQ